MSELRIQSLRIPAARLGPENPLPSLKSQRKPFNLKISSDVPDEIKENIRYGHMSNIAPYTLQDGYNRQLNAADFRVAILENEILRAIFLIEFGGRLWSLVHKPTHRELLEVNPVFQLANLAIRNAWFSGGVEWNIGTTGHSPFTCSPLFTARLNRPDGTPVLRFYEWERFRQIPFQIDVCLPDHSPVLFLHIFIKNPNTYDVPMYWWSNIALPQKQGTRVIIPSDSAFCLGCEREGFIRIPVPRFNETDITYPTNVKHAADIFFVVPYDRRPWITVLDSEGKGLIQVSTPNLIGRKLWTWGSGQGGKNWQQLLSPGGNGYIEIQAGITHTQFEHLRMPAGAQWSWLEAYGLLEAHPSAVHGPDWGIAQKNVEFALEELISTSTQAHEFDLGNAIKNMPPLEVIQHGSGWGALEILRREIFGEPIICGEGLIFTKDSLNEEQSPWVSLVKNGTFPKRDPALAPNGYVVEAKWRTLLEKSLKIGRSENWYAWFHAGVMRHNTGDFEGARRAWERSLDLTWTVWSSRNLGILAWIEGRYEDALGFLLAACRKRPNLLPLAVECGQFLIETNQSSQFLDLFDDFPERIQTNGRIRLLHAQAALQVNDYQTVKKFFSDGIVIDDLREGEESLTELWYAYHEQIISAEGGYPNNDSMRTRIRNEFPVPREYDYRMNT